MAKQYPPYMNATGTISKILEKIKVAATPSRFTQDYLATELNFPGGSPKAFIPFAKKLELLSTDGTPTELYKQFRNSKTSKAAMAVAIKKGYSDLYTKNEYAHSLGKKELEGLILEVTGAEQGNKAVGAIVTTFEVLKGFADFEKKITENDTHTKTPASIDTDIGDGLNDLEDELKLNLSYTINLVLPKTDDVAVFNAIFRSLKENLLKK
jgi:hypothetical protein